MVAVGVALHLPMFLMGRKTGYRLVGMPMDPGMLVGMALIILGILAAAYGLLPQPPAQRVSLRIDHAARRCAADEGPLDTDRAGRRRAG